jgi:hypothetical protein
LYFPIVDVALVLEALAHQRYYVAFRYLTSRSDAYEG